jgi:SAM-dependent methyltransferase
MIKRMKVWLKRSVRALVGDYPVSLEEMPDCPALFHIYRTLLLTGHKRAPGGWIYENEFYPDYLTVGGNTFAIRRIALKYCKGQGIDIGAAYWPLPGSTPIDTEQGPGTANRLEDVHAESQDYVFSSHCLEHVEDWESALDVWISKLKPAGILFLYLPHPSCKLWHVSNPFMSGIHKWAPDPVTVRNALINRGLEVVEEDEGPDHFYSFYICAKKDR